MSRTSSGYILEMSPHHPLADKRGRVLQHRKIWFDANGAIPDRYVIHHINGDKKDNRLENLELCTRSGHMKEHYPNGFCNVAWNKGTTEYAQVACEQCGTTFSRLAKEVRKKKSRGSRVLCTRHCGKDKGWTLLKSGKYQVQYRNKYLGLFETAEAAHEAYQRASGKP